MQISTQFDIGQRVKIHTGRMADTFKKQNGIAEGIINDIWINKDHLFYTVIGELLADGSQCSAPFNEEDLESVLI
jgi:hypothetical protein